MQITMKETEFKEAIVVWLKEQGFDPEVYDIDMKVIPGRKYGTTVEIDLEPKVASYLEPKPSVPLTGNVKAILQEGKTQRVTEPNVTAEATSLLLFDPLSKE